MKFQTANIKNLIITIKIRIIKFALIMNLLKLLKITKIMKKIIFKKII